MTKELAPSLLHGADVSRGLGGDGMTLTLDGALTLVPADYFKHLSASLVPDTNNRTEESTLVIYF